MTHIPDTGKQQERLLKRAGMKPSRDASDRRSAMQFITDNKKLVMPIVLVVAVLCTVIIALRANERAAKEIMDDAGLTEASVPEYTVPDVPLEEDAYPEVNELLSAYFDAYENGDMDTIEELYEGLDDMELLKLREVSSHIDDIEKLNIYTKPGPVAGTWIAYVYTEVRFTGFDKALPGMQTMYICTADDGSLYINGGVVEDRVRDYINEVSLQGDVVDLNNSVAAAYNDMVAQDPELEDFLATMYGEIDTHVSEALVQLQGGDVAAAGDDSEAEASSETETEETGTDNAGEGAGTGGQETETEEETQEPVKVMIKARNVVNIRTSDSETADKIAKTRVGDEFEQLEALPNGWSRISYNGGEAYVKSEYFDVLTPEPEETEPEAQGATAQAAASASTSAASASTTSTAASTAASSAATQAASTISTGRHKAIDSVRLRTEPSTDATIRKTLFPGAYVEVLESTADGWSKVTYEGLSGYVKTEFLE